MTRFKYTQQGLANLLASAIFLQACGPKPVTPIITDPGAQKQEYKNIGQIGEAIKKSCADVGDKDTDGDLICDKDETNSPKLGEKCVTKEFCDGSLPDTHKSFWDSSWNVAAVAVGGAALIWGIGGGILDRKKGTNVVPWVGTKQRIKTRVGSEIDLNVPDWKKANGKAFMQRFSNNTVFQKILVDIEQTGNIQMANIKFGKGIHICISTEFRIDANSASISSGNIDSQLIHDKTTVKPTTIFETTKETFDRGCVEARNSLYWVAIEADGKYVTTSITPEALGLRDTDKSGIIATLSRMLFDTKTIRTSPSFVFATDQNSNRSGTFTYDGILPEKINETTTCTVEKLIKGLLLLDAACYADTKFPERNTWKVQESVNPNPIVDGNLTPYNPDGAQSEGSDAACSFLTGKDKDECCSGFKDYPYQPDACQ